MLAYQWGYIVYGEFLEKIAIREVVMTFGIVLGLVVYVSYAVLNEGYFSLNENPRRVVILFAIIAAGNLLIGLAQIPLGRFFCKWSDFVSGSKCDAGIDDAVCVDSVVCEKIL